MSEPRKYTAKENRAICSISMVASLLTMKAGVGMTKRFQNVSVCGNLNFAKVFHDFNLWFGLMGRVVKGQIIHPSTNNLPIEKFLGPVHYTNYIKHC